MRRRADWPAVADEALVERMIPLVQRAIVEASRGAGSDVDATVELAAPDVANVLLMVLATIVEPSPGCATPTGIRLTGEAMGRELAELIRDVRRLRLAAAAPPGSMQ